MSDQTSPKSAFRALLLCIFLSAFGAHNFYLGKISAAFKYLILFLCIFLMLNYGSGINHKIQCSCSDTTSLRYNYMLLSEFIRMCIIGFMIISLVDVVEIILNKYKDNDGNVLILLNQSTSHRLLKLVMTLSVSFIIAIFSTYFVLSISSGGFLAGNQVNCGFGQCAKADNGLKIKGHLI